MANQKAKFKKAVAAAKRLYKTGRYKTFGDAVKSAYKKVGSVRSVSKKNRQTGRSNKKADSQRKAKRPGKRRSASGKKYTERRRNRSDVPGSLTGIWTTAALASALRKQYRIKLANALLRKDQATNAKTYRAASNTVKETSLKLNRI